MSSHVRATSGTSRTSISYNSILHILTHANNLKLLQLFSMTRLTVQNYCWFTFFHLIICGIFNNARFDLFDLKVHAPMTDSITTMLAVSFSAPMAFHTFSSALQVLPTPMLVATPSVSPHPHRSVTSTRSTAEPVIIRTVI